MNEEPSPAAELSRLIARLCDDSLDEAGRQRLNELLTADPAAQEAYLDHLALDGLLEREFGGEVALPTTHRAASRPPRPAHARRSFFSYFRRSAWAGLTAGVLCSSMVWAYAVPKLAELAEKLLPIGNPGFEAPTPVGSSGMPQLANVWSGDFTEVAGSDQGIAPREGGNMLRFLRGDDARSRPGSAPSRSSEVWQIVKLDELRKIIGDEPATIEFAAHFNAVSGSNGRYVCGISIHAFKGGITDASLMWRDRADQALACGTKEQLIDSPKRGWHRVATRIVVPANAEVLLLQLRYRDTTPDLKETAVFSGHYADDCSLRLVGQADEH